MQDLKGRPSEGEVMNSPVDCSLVRGCWAPGWPTKEKLLPQGGSFFYKKAMQDLKGRPSESEVMNSPVDCSLVRGCWAPGWPIKEMLLP